MQRNCYRVGLLTALTGVLVAGVGQGAGAQVAYDAPGVRVEVLGLQQWTLRALQDSIRHRVRGQSLADAACMVTLRDSLHFADASVNSLSYSTEPGAAERHYLVIKVIEPEDSARVHWRPAPKDSFTVLRPEYAAVILPVTDSLGRLPIGRLLGPLQLYTSNTAARAAAIRSWPPAAREDAERLWGFLDAHRAAADRRNALDAVRRDGPYPNRMVATLVLVNFAQQDSTWWALAEALRDGNEAVREAARTVLRGLPTRPVNWAPAVPALRALLGGTNVAATQDVLELLDRTHVSPALARPLLHDNGGWVLMHLRAEYPMASYSAHALLVRLNNGRDLGASDAAWVRWLEML